MLTVFVADGCPYCRLLLEDLSRRRVSYAAVDLTREPGRLVELAARTRERRVPVVVDHEVCSVGFGGGSTALSELGIERLAILSGEGGESNR